MERGTRGTSGWRLACCRSTGSDTAALSGLQATGAQWNTLLKDRHGSLWIGEGSTVSTGHLEEVDGGSGQLA